MSWTKCLTLWAAALVASAAFAQPPEAPGNGQVYQSSGGAVIWSDAAAAWLQPEAFWAEASAAAPGRDWGRGEQYPPYAQVGEHDTFLVIVPQGPCLMYFFHERWRRAQDVRRWDEAQNELLGCPNVFD